MMLNTSLIYSTYDVFFCSNNSTKVTGQNVKKKLSKIFFGETYILLEEDPDGDESHLIMLKL